MKNHELKIAPEFFEAIAAGEKTFELRKEDRGFNVGDVLWLREWKDDRHTGRELKKRATYLLSGWGLSSGYVCIALGEYQLNERG